MAGKQFTFFLGPSDQLGFEQAVRASGDVALLKDLSNSRIPEEVPTSRVLAMGRENLNLWIARRQDLSLIEFKPINERNVFSCDPTFAPIIEFSRCYATNRFIRAGRLYRVDKYWDESKQLLSKPNSFIEWADRLYRLTKASLTKIEQGCYAGTEALELRKAGVALEGVDIEIGALQE